MAGVDFNAETKVTFEPSNYMQMAGLTNFYNHLCWSWVFVTWDEKRNKRVIEVAQNDFDTYTSFLKDTAIAIPDDIESVWLRTKVRTRTYTYEYSFDGKTWHEIPVTLDAAVLSDDHVPNVMADSYRRVRRVGGRGPFRIRQRSHFQPFRLHGNMMTPGGFPDNQGKSPDYSALGNERRHLWQATMNIAATVAANVP